MFYHLKIRRCVNTVLVQPLLIISVLILSCEKRLIAKKHTVTHKHLKFDFKWTLHFNTLAVKLFHSATKLF